MTPFYLPYLNLVGVAIICIAPLFAGLLLAVLLILRNREVMLHVLLLLAVVALCFVVPSNPFGGVLWNSPLVLFLE